jgi:CHASE2 domain-containing sensor protein
MTPPRRPRPSREQKPTSGGTALALLALLAVTGGLIGLGTLVMPQVFGIVGVVFGFFCFGAIHYLLWGWWLKALPPEEDKDEENR